MYCCCIVVVEQGCGKGQLELMVLPLTHVFCNRLS